MDGAPNCWSGRVGFERGYAAWIDFSKLVEGVVPGINPRPTARRSFSAAGEIVP
jgi:hypothetical protein